MLGDMSIGTFQLIISEAFLNKHYAIFYCIMHSVSLEMHAAACCTALLKTAQLDWGRGEDNRRGQRNRLERQEVGEYPHPPA